MPKRARSRAGRASTKPPRGDLPPISHEPAGQPPSATAADSPASEAIAAFERAIRTVQRHDYERGAEAFRELIEKFPDERALLERARVYVELCRRELKQKAPQTVEERMTAATAALNDDDDRTAERLAREILAEQPRHDLALYLLAAVEVRRGAHAEALGFLRQAVAISPEAGAQARLDADFDSLREDETFRRLTAQPEDDAGR